MYFSTTTLLTLLLTPTLTLPQDPPQEEEIIHTNSFTSSDTTTTTYTTKQALPLSPPTNTNTTYHGLSLNANVANTFSPAIYEPIPIEIAVLTTTVNLSCSELIFDDGVAINVDLSKVQCRAYMKTDGTVPASAVFEEGMPAMLSTDLVGVGSVFSPSDTHKLQRQFT